MLPGTRWEHWEDELTVPRLNALYAEFEQHPPVAVLVAGYLDYKKPPRRKPAVITKTSANGIIDYEEDPYLELAAMFPGGVIK
jgi:hypothetical protein